jgi:hypothetical protein
LGKNELQQRERTGFGSNFTYDAIDEARLERKPNTLSRPLDRLAQHVVRKGSARECRT